MNISYLGLGSNISDRIENLQNAIFALQRVPGVRVDSCSSVYDTDPVGEILDQPSFLNACVRIQTSLEPKELLACCKKIEEDFGRDPSLPRHSPRPIDIDLLLFGTREYRTESLVLPHEQVMTRRFVLIPLLELDFELSLPSGEKLADALAALPLSEGVRFFSAPMVLEST